MLLLINYIPKYYVHCSTLKSLSIKKVMIHLTCKKSFQVEQMKATRTLGTKEK